MDNVTIVSACDRNFLWGAYLLAVSTARFIPDVKVLILVTGFMPEDRKLLEQFPNVRLGELDNSDPRNVANRKSEALLSADTEFVAWMDADCFIIGDIRPYLIPANGKFQIRIRGEAENADVWRNHYTREDERGKLPKAVAEQWRRDVGQLHTPRVQSACVTNAFVIHRDHLDFIREWKSQIAKVIPARHAGVVDKSDPSYFMTDESVLSSLIAFSRSTPDLGEFQMDKVATAHLAHFGANPKPWKRWRKSTWRVRDVVLDTLDWAREKGYALPPLPPSLKRSHAVPQYIGAMALHMKDKAKAIAGKVVRWAK
jgi:hypothetical protein